MKHCNRCNRTLPLSQFYWMKPKNRPTSECKQCCKDRTMERFRNKREHCLNVRRRYRSNNREQILLVDRKLRARRKLLVLTHYGKGALACVCCGIQEIEFLTLDHIAANGADHRRELKERYHQNAPGGWFIYKWLIDNGFPVGYQTLCFNCNVGKHRSKVNICPHELARQELLIGSVRLNHAA